MTSNSPRITVRLTTSSPVFDLSQPAPFTITLGLTLSYASPITFIKRYTSLFDGKLLYQGGLTFTNTATGQQVPRGTIDICYRSHGCRGLSWETRADYVTLYPDREHAIDLAIKPVKSGYSRYGVGSEKNDVRNEGLKWFGLCGFEDGQTYELGVSDEAVVKEWMVGSIWEILGWQMLGGTTEKKRDVIRYTALEPASFEIRRPDADGSLNWP